MEGRDEPLPDDIETLKAALVIERGKRIVAETDAAFAKARASDDQALIAHLKLQIEKLNRDRYGPRSERTARLLDQLELTLEELETAATEDELAAEMAAAKAATTKVASFTRKRPFFVMADLAENARRKAQGKKPAVISPLALEVVRRIDALFEIERAINAQSPERRKAIRQELSAPLVADLEAWMREQRATLSPGNDVAKAMDYMLKRWIAFTRFLEDGRICLSNNAAERGVRGIALGRKSWLFCGSDRGGERAAVMYSLIVTAKMNDIDPQAWLADVLARIAEHPVQKLDELLPWNWRQLNVTDSQAA
jgi:hypothetical protein